MIVKTLLSRQHKLIFLLAITVSIVLFAISYQMVVIDKSICQSSSFSDRVLSVQKFLFGGIFGVCYLYLCKYFSGSFVSEGDNFASAYRTSLFISLISATSGLLQYMDVFETTCEDQYGVQSPVAQWIEWQVSVPMMFYLNIALDDKKKSLTMSDSFIIFCAWASIASCWLLNFNFSSKSSVLLITSSTVFMAIALVVNVYISRSSYMDVKTLIDSSDKKCVLEDQYFRVLRRKYNASFFLLQMFPIFALVYFAGLLKYIDNDSVLIGFLTLNFLAKLVFSMWIMDAHHDILDTNVYVLLAEQKANASRRSFLRYVLHEVRVPLNSISMGLHLLDCPEYVDSESSETIVMMREAVSFMSNTLNDVLSIQKIEEGKLQLQFESFDVAAVLRTVRHSLKGQTVVKNIRMVEQLDKDVPAKIKGDRFRIEHILANFVSNALKFSPVDGTVTIAVHNVSRPAEQEPRPNHQIIEFSVIDEGVGISEEDQKKLFTHYTQFDSGALQEGKGTGVGLAICRETVHLHGGRIGVRSEKRTSTQKGGSEFFFSIDFEVIERIQSGGNVDQEPVDEKKSTAKSVESATNALSTTVVPSKREKLLELKDMKTWNILITDDVSSNRKLLAMLLKKKGIESYQAVDGVQCLEYVEQNPEYFDLIFMDNMMPNMIGTVATEYIRRKKFNGTVIGLTGDAMDEDVQNFMSAGADVVLSKPLKFIELSKILEHLSVHGFSHEKNMEGYEEMGSKTKLQRLIIS